MIFCSGKVYYDLLKYRQENKLTDAAAIIRIEQLYPLYKEKLSRLAKPLHECQEVRLVPGRAAEHGRVELHPSPTAQSLHRYINYAGRPASASPAAGTMQAHQAEQAALVKAGLRSLTSSLSLPMNIEVKVPAVGESITSGILSVWHKKDGEAVNAGDVLFTLETDKVSTEVNAAESGILKTQVAEGDEVKIGQVVAIIETPAARLNEQKPAEPAAERCREGAR